MRKPADQTPMGDTNTKPEGQTAAAESTAVPPTIRRQRVQSTRSTRGFIESAEQQTGQDRPRLMKSRGDARDSLDAIQTQAVDRATDEKFKELQFMEDTLTVRIHESSNPMDAPIPAVWNDGVSQYFIRGQEQNVKRKFVEILARLKKTTYSQQKRVNAVGDEEYVQIPHTSLLYPFAVIADPSPRGSAWLRSVMQEA